MKFKKLFLSLIIGILALTMAACANDSEQPASGGSESLTDTEPVAVDIELINMAEDRLPSIVYSVSAQQYELEAAQTLSDKLYLLTKKRIRPATEAMEYNADTIEIIVGKTDHKESQEVYKALGYGESVAKVIGNKIVLAGYNKEALESVISELMTEIIKNKTEEGIYTLSKDFATAVQDNALLAQIPYAEGFGAASKVTDTGDGCYMLTFESVTEEALKSYVATFGNKGYEKHDENVIENNRFYTYANDKYALTAVYTGRDNKARLLIQSLQDTALPTLEEDNKYTPVSGCDTTITQLGLYYPYGDNPASKYFNGMSYAIRLEDGSFILIDGGHNKSIDGDRIYNVLKKQAPDPDNIVIAAWVFTHAHSDHVGFFKSFAENYANKVTVEQFIYNFPSDEQKNGLADNQDMVEPVLRQYFLNVPRVKAHAGQVFHIRNAKVTMLYTLEMCEDKLTDYNTTSLVFTVEAEGYKFMVLGDYAEQGKTLRNMYTSKTLKSDIMQVSHHGVAGQSNDTYKIIAPEYALWPAGDYVVSFTYNGAVQTVKLKETSWNAYMLEEMDQSKVFWALDDIVILTLGENGITSQTFENDTAYLNG